MTIAYGVRGVVVAGAAPGGLFLPVLKGVDDKELKIAWVAPGGTLSKRVKVEFEFEFGGVTLKVPCSGTIEGKGGAKDVTIEAPDLKALAGDLLGQIAGLGPIPLGTNPLAAGLKSKKVTITPVLPDGLGFAAQPAETNDALQVEFKAQGVCPPVPMPPDPMRRPLQDEEGKGPGNQSNPRLVPEPVTKPGNVPELRLPPVPPK